MTIKRGSENPKLKEATVYVVVTSKGVVLSARTSLAAAYQDAFENVLAESILFWNGTKGEMVHFVTKGVSGLKLSEINGGSTSSSDYLEA